MVVFKLYYDNDEITKRISFTQKSQIYNIRIICIDITNINNRTNDEYSS